jgi:integrase
MPAIQTVTRTGGREAYRFTLNLGRDPVTGNRRQRVYTYPDLKTAERERARLTGQLVEGRFTDRTATTVNAALDAYLRSALFEREAATRVSYTGALLPVRERLGARKLQSLTRADVEDLRDWLLTSGRRRGGTPGTPLGARSVALTLGRLRAALELACAEGLIARNPAEHVRPPRQAKRAATTWSAGQLRAFLELAGADRLAACWRMTLYGMRRGEVAGLRWDAVDLDAGTVTIGLARVLVYGKVVIKAPKSERGFRTLPLDPDLIAALRLLHKRQAAERLAAGGAYEPGPGGGWVAADELGAPVHPEWLTDEFGRLAAAAGLPRIRLHDARHSMNSLLAAAGVPDHIRAAWCGHTVTVNVAVYTHARPEDLAVAGRALAGILAGA